MSAPSRRVSNWRHALVTGVAGSCRLAPIVGLLVGCASVGPPSIVRDRFDYATAISDSWKTQMLANMVRVRYSEAPVFLNVESAISSYSLSVSGDLSGSVYPKDSASSYLSVGGSVSYGDHPTITYNPLVGDRFSKSLLTPLPPAVLLTLIQAGWNAEVLLRACVQSINGLQNVGGRLLLRRDPDPGFVRLLELIGRIQKAGGMGVRVVGDKDTGETLFYFSRPDPPPAVAADVREAEKLLGVSVDAAEFKASFGVIPKGDRELAILTRSMLEILLELSSYVEVPPSHISEERAAPGFETFGKRGGLPPLIRIHSSGSPPPDAFAVTRYRDHWFWISDRDFQSKGVFSFLMFLFTISETGTRAVTPILTVPAG